MMDEHQIKQKFKCENCGCEIFDGGCYNCDGPHDATCIKCGTLHNDIYIAYDFNQERMNIPNETLYDEKFMPAFILNIYQERFPGKDISNMKLLECMQELLMKHGKDYLTKRYDEYAQSLTENKRQEFDKCRKEFYDRLMDIHTVKKIVLGKALME